MAGSGGSGEIGVVYFHEKSGFARPGILLMVGSRLVSYLAEFFSLRQNPQGLVGSSMLAFLQSGAGGGRATAAVSAHALIRHSSAPPGFEHHSQLPGVWEKQPKVRARDSTHADLDAECTARNRSDHRLSLSSGASMFAAILVRR